MIAKKKIPLEILDMARSFEAKRDKVPPAEFEKVAREIVDWMMGPFLNYNGHESSLRIASVVYAMEEAQRAKKKREGRT
jgi:hypothetical protein